MIRGVSKQIIEVKETDNLYYESAYLVVKPEFANAERAVLEREALKLLRAMDAPSGSRGGANGCPLGCGCWHRQCWAPALPLYFPWQFCCNSGDL